MHVGIDFGTSNTALSVSDGERSELATFSLFGEATASFRSVLYVSEESGRPVLMAGPRAIEQYLGDKGSGRMLQSLKSFLTSRLFEGTRIYDRRWTLEELIGFFLRELRKAAEAQFGPLGGSVTIGRPVVFVGGEGEKEETLALDRLRRSAAVAGFDDVRFTYEPLAAARAYEQRLGRDETLLVGDFGGGTSDFCVIRVGPRASTLPPNERILGTSGVPIAGNIFDGRIVTHYLAPFFGRGGTYRSMGGKVLPIPDWIFQRLASWHEIGFMRETRTLSSLHELAVLAEESAPLLRLITLIEENLGYSLFRAVEESKVELSRTEKTRFAFQELTPGIDVAVVRPVFEDLIERDVALIRQGLDRVLEASGCEPGAIDRVFLTGGSAFVPKVRGVFSSMFGAEKVSGGNELTSVASGLSLSLS